MLRAASVSDVNPAVHDPSCGTGHTALDDTLAVHLDIHFRHAAGMTDLNDILILCRFRDLIPGILAAAPVPTATVIG